MAVIRPQTRKPADSTKMVEMPAALGETTANAGLGDELPPVGDRPDGVEPDGDEPVGVEPDGDEPDGVDECICPSDIVSEGVITDDELFQLYDAKAKGVKLVVISDSCHSGSVARFAPILTPPTMKGKSAPQRKVRFLPPAVFLARKQITPLGEVMRHRATSAPGRHAALLLSGCQDTEYSYDAWFEGRANGAFTYVAIQALARLSPKSTYNDWSKAIRAVLPSAQYPQSPNLFGTTTMKKWKVLE